MTNRHDLGVSTRNEGSLYTWPVVTTSITTSVTTPPCPSSTNTYRTPGDICVSTASSAYGQRSTEQNRMYEYGDSHMYTRDQSSTGARSKSVSFHGVGAVDSTQTRSGASGGQLSDPRDFAQGGSVFVPDTPLSQYIRQPRVQEHTGPSVVGETILTPPQYASTPISVGAPESPRDCNTVFPSYASYGNLTTQSSSKPRVHRKQKDPQQFDGSGDFKDYILHFEQVALWNQWGNYEKAQQLAMSLRGPAQKVLSTLTMYQVGDYGKIRDVLAAQFDPPGRETAYRCQLKHRTRNDKESLVSYGRELANTKYVSPGNLRMPVVRITSEAAQRREEAAARRRQEAGRSQASDLSQRSAAMTVARDQEVVHLGRGHAVIRDQQRWLRGQPASRECPYYPMDVDFDQFED